MDPWGTGGRSIPEDSRTKNQEPLEVYISCEIVCRVMEPPGEETTSMSA